MMRRRTTRGLFAATPLVLLLASSPFPGGCGSGVTASVLAAGSPPDSTCAVDSSGMIGSSCTDQTASASSSCPANAPLGCAQGQCCPSNYPVCCANSAWCGATAGACQSEVDFPSDPPGQHGVNTSVGGSSTPGTTASTSGGVSCQTYVAPYEPDDAVPQDCSPVDGDAPCGTETSTGQTCCCNGTDGFMCVEFDGVTSTTGCGFCALSGAMLGAVICDTDVDGAPITCPAGSTCVRNDDGDGYKCCM